VSGQRLAPIGHPCKRVGPEPREWWASMPTFGFRLRHGASQRASIKEPISPGPGGRLPGRRVGATVPLLARPLLQCRCPNAYLFFRLPAFCDAPRATGIAGMPRSASPEPDRQSGAAHNRARVAGRPLLKGVGNAIPTTGLPPHRWGFFGMIMSPHARAAKWEIRTCSPPSQPRLARQEGAIR
jgi:hypothetical protein